MRHAANSSQLVNNVTHYMLCNKMKTYWGISDTVLSCTCFLPFWITFSAGRWLSCY